MEICVRVERNEGLKMLRFSLGVTRMERFRNKVIRGTIQTGRLGGKAREARLRCFWTCAEEGQWIHW